MSDYHRIYMKLTDMIERGCTVSVEKRLGGFEVTVFAPHGHGHPRDHLHTDRELLTDAMAAAHSEALERWFASAEDR